MTHQLHRGTLPLPHSSLSLCKIFVFNFPFVSLFLHNWSLQLENAFDWNTDASNFLCYFGTYKIWAIERVKGGKRDRTTHTQLIRTGCLYLFVRCWSSVYRSWSVLYISLVENICSPFWKIAWDILAQKLIFKLFIYLYSFSLSLSLILSIYPSVMH